MKKFFKNEGGFFRGMTMVTDFIILGILVLVFSIPVITIGPALSAAYYVALKEVKNEEGYVVKSFWKAFKQNFRQGFLIELITFGVAGLLYYNITITYEWAHTEQNVYASLLFYVSLGFLIVVIAAAIYIFPMLAKFNNKISKLFINSLAMAIRHFPQTIIMFVMDGCLVYMTIIFPPFLLFTISIFLYVNSFIMARIFNIYTPPKEEEKCDDFHIDMN